MEVVLIAVGVIAFVVAQVFKEQKKRDRDELPYSPTAPPTKAVSAQHSWNGFLDARGANAFWSFGNQAADPDWVEVIIGPDDSGLRLMPKQYRPGQPAQPVTLPWDTVLSATRGTESQDDAHPGSSLESAAVIKLNLHALGEPGAYPAGELAIVRCFGKTGSVLVTEINKHLYGRVAPRPATTHSSPAPNLPPPRPRTLPPRQVAPPPAQPVRPSPASVAGAPIPAPPPMHRPAPAVAAAPSAPTVAAVPTADPAPVTDESGLVAADEAVAFGDAMTAGPESVNLDALTPATIEISSFDSPLDLTAYAPDDEEPATTAPLIAAPWPPPVAFVLPDSVKVTDDQQ
jgi:hypothetical protein